MATALGLVTAGVLVALAALHVIWARGGHWPLSDRDALFERVTPPGMARPGPPETWLIAVLLAAGAVLVALSAIGVDTWITFAGTMVVGIVLLLRGLGGLVVSGLWRTDSTFARLDRRVFAPLCLALALGAAVSLPG